MRRVIVLGLLLLAGCKGTVGPFQSRQRPPVDPLFSIEEQRMRAYDRYSLPFDDRRTVPNAYIDQRQFEPGGRVN